MASVWHCRTGVGALYVPTAFIPLSVGSAPFVWVQTAVSYRAVPVRTSSRSTLGGALPPHSLLRCLDRLVLDCSRSATTYPADEEDDDDDDDAAAAPRVLQGEERGQCPRFRESGPPALARPLQPFRHWPPSRGRVVFHGAQRSPPSHPATPPLYPRGVILSLRTLSSR